MQYSVQHVVAIPTGPAPLSTLISTAHQPTLATNGPMAYTPQRIERHAGAPLTGCASGPSALHGADGRDSTAARKDLFTDSGAGASGYGRHRPDDTVLYGVVEQHADAFFEGQDERGRGLPRFVREEFEATLHGGRLEHGFIRAKCTGCRHEHRVAFSGKRRGGCPSCASRRMAESGAHLVDNVLPKAPYRQWVLSFPWPLRRLFAAQPKWLTRVLSVVIRALSGALLKRAGVRHCDGARTGTVTFI